MTIINLISQGYLKELLYRQIPNEQEEEHKGTIELNHSHCILFDGGRLNERLSNLHRDKFVVAACHDSGPTCMYFNHFLIKYNTMF